MDNTRDCVIVVPELARWSNDFKILSSYLTDSGWQVEIFFPEQKKYKKDWALDDVQKQTIATVQPALTSALPITTRLGRPSVWDLLRTVRVAAYETWRRDDLFILWSAFSLIIFGPWVRILNRKALYLVTGLGATFGRRHIGSLRTKLICLLYRFLFSSNRARVIVHNKEDKQELIEKTGVSAEQVFVTGGCGVDPLEYDFDPTPTVFPERPVILVPSRILRDKGSLEAAEASSILTQRGIKHRMIFTHEPWFGREDSITEAELKQVESYPDVEFIGFQKNMIDVYHAADVVCIPSWYREGLQTSMLETSAAGVPFVACDNVGVRDYVRPSVDALIAQPRDAVSLANKLEELLLNPKMADQLRHSARQRLLDGFTSKHMLEITIKALSELDERIKPVSYDS